MPRLQVVETVNRPRADRGTIFESAGADESGWRNRLIWGDNLHVLAWPGLADGAEEQILLTAIYALRALVVDRALERGITLLTTDAKLCRA